MNRNRREFKFLIYVLAFVAIFQFINHIVKKNSVENEEKYEKIMEHHNRVVAEIESEGEKISWIDEKFVEMEKRRKGPGEQGEPYYLTDPVEIKENEEWYKKEGFFVIVSDKISVDRAMPDFRPEK